MSCGKRRAADEGSPAAEPMRKRHQHDLRLIACLSATLAVLGMGQSPSMPGSCTIFSVAKGGSVFFGNNEDWRNPLTYIWVEPAGDGKYGVLCLGFDDLGPQGGVNE